MKKLLREPLLHFLILGGLLFAAYGVIARPSAQVDGSTQVLVTQQQIDSLIASYQANQRKAPTNEELQNLINEYAREEMLYREGVRMGLDQGDSVIRQRVLQKLQYFVENSASAEPTDAQLQTYFEKNAADFKSEPRFSLTQVYIDPDLHKAGYEARATQLLDRLHKQSAPKVAEGMSDPTGLPADLTDAGRTELLRTFGDDFARTLAEIEPGHWEGPVRSRFGYHVVFLQQRTEGAIPTFAEAREAVSRAWQRAQQQQAVETFFKAMIARYSIKIEGQPATTATPAPAASG